MAAQSCVEDVKLGPSDAGSDGAAGEAGAPTEGTGGPDATGGATGSGGMGAGGDGNGGAGGGKPCDSAVSPADDACVVSDAHAVFVAPDGDDRAQGTMDAPVATFERAHELTANDARIVIACSGTYDEQIRIARGVRMYGGFDCAIGWTYEPSSPSRVSPTEPGVVLEIRDADGLVVVESIELIAAGATELGASSTAGFVVNSAGAMFRSVRFEAGSGARGADGASSSFDWPTAEELAGNDASGTAGGARKQCSCPYGQDPGVVPTLETAGGKGGDAQPGGQPGSAGESARRERGTQIPLPGGPGGAVGNCDVATQAGAPGHFGGYASVGGEFGVGTLTASGWQPALTGHGIPGHPGDGGGGGASTATGGGGGGGCGGCGGKGGLGGQGGGASLGIVIIDTPVTLESSMVVARNGGNGGDGGDGQPGQAGGLGGRGSPSACDGGAGGNGAMGGPGGGGVGGSSFGVLWMGASEPAITLTTITTGEVGEPGYEGNDQDLRLTPGMAAAVISVSELPRM
jgi:hypothetical protein